jgi:hypothetical protein
LSATGASFTGSLHALGYEVSMLDAVYVLIVAAFFAAALVYALAAPHI